MKDLQPFDVNAGLTVSRKDGVVAWDSASPETKGSCLSKMYAEKDRLEARLIELLPYIAAFYPPYCDLCGAPGTVGITLKIIDDNPKNRNGVVLYGCIDYEACIKR